MRFFTIFIFLVSPLTLFAQPPAERYPASENRPVDEGALVLSFSGVINGNTREVRNRQASDFDIGVGAMVESNFDSNFGIETGVILMTREYDLTAANIRVIRQAQQLHFPVMGRYWFNNYFSVAVGPFVGLKVGTENTTLEIGDETVATIKTSAEDTVEYGLDAAATFNFAVNRKTGLFVEGRYTTPFSTESGESADQFSGLVGIKMTI